MAALELSYDKDWFRIKSSVFYASGSANPSSSRARGFDSIDDFPEFAGGIFSFWNRESIRLTGSGVALNSGDSLLPDLRSNKDEGQANFVNPGIFLANIGAEFDLTPKLRGFANVNYLRFERTETLEQILFQSPIHHSIGVDSSFGVRYRPPLTENISIAAGAATLIPGQGLKDIYTGRDDVFAFHRFAIPILSVTNLLIRIQSGSADGSTARKRSMRRACVAIIVVAAAAATALLFEGRSHAQSPAQQPSLLGQTQADVDRKSAGCVSCHASTDEPSMHPNGTVRLGCVDCHGGDSTASSAPARSPAQRSTNS